MEIKYEAVFGPQELFEGMMDDCELVCGEYGYKVKVSDLFYCEKYNQRYGWSKSTKSVLQLHPVTAMRRIIRTPTWTVADKKAGKLPEVGCRVFDVTNENEATVKAINKRQVCLESIDGFIYLLPPYYIKPIESPEEKAARLREEWCNEAVGVCSLGMTTSTRIYDALLSGDLPVPAKGE